MSNNTPKENYEPKIETVADLFDNHAVSTYEVIDLTTDESHGEYPTLEQARGCVRFDKLRAYSIWHGNVRVECCDPYDGDDYRVKQALGEPNASEGDN